MTGHRGLSAGADLLAEIVRQFPLELDERRLLDLALVADVAPIARRGRPLVGLRWVRTSAGVDVLDLHELLAEAAYAGAVVGAVVPAFYGGVRRLLHPGPLARPSPCWEVRAGVAHLVGRAALLPGSTLRERLLASPAVARAAPGAPLDLALGAGSLRA